jgi:hypothetical protein
MLACGQGNSRHTPRMAARGIFSYSMIAVAKSEQQSGSTNFIAERSSLHDSTPEKRS